MPNGNQLQTVCWYEITHDFEDFSVSYFFYWKDMCTIIIWYIFTWQTDGILGDVFASVVVVVASAVVVSISVVEIIASSKNKQYF